jgi:hypothetical protein
MCAVVTVIFGVCNSVRLSELFVATLCKCSVNPITHILCANIMFLFIFSSSLTQSVHNFYTDTCREVRETKITGSSSDDWIY